MIDVWDKVICLRFKDIYNFQFLTFAEIIDGYHEEKRKAGLGANVLFAT